MVAERNTGRINKRTPTEQTNNKNHCLWEKEQGGGTVTEAKRSQIF